MAEEIENTVKTTSDGTVKITVERYQELLEKSQEKAPVYNYTTMQKTPAMVANDNLMWGSVFMSGGLAVAGIGAVIFAVGLKQKRAL